MHNLLIWGGKMDIQYIAIVRKKWKKTFFFDFFMFFPNLIKEDDSHVYILIPHTNQVKFWSQVNKCWPFVDLFRRYFWNFHFWPFPYCFMLFLHKEKWFWSSTKSERKNWKFWKWVIIWKIHSRELLIMSLNCLNLDYHRISMHGHF